MLNVAVEELQVLFELFLSMVDIYLKIGYSWPIPVSVRSKAVGVQPLYS